MRVNLTNLTVKKDAKVLIDQLSCTFTTGITYIVGKNGAGKSTILKLLATVIQPVEGKVIYTMSKNANGMGRKTLTIDEVRKVIGLLPQYFIGYPEMTIERYLTYIAFHKGIPRKLVKLTVDKWLEETDLITIKNKHLVTLSGGQLQKIGLIQALMNHPRLCLLDEPFTGLDTQERLFFRRKIERLSYHSAVVITTHSLEEIDPVASNRLFYLEDGKQSFYGGADQLDQIIDRITKE